MRASRLGTGGALDRDRATSSAARLHVRPPTDLHPRSKPRTQRRRIGFRPMFSVRSHEMWWSGACFLEIRRRPRFIDREIAWWRSSIRLEPARSLSIATAGADERHADHGVGPWRRGRHLASPLAARPSVTLRRDREHKGDESERSGFSAFVLTISGGRRSPFAEIWNSCPWPSRSAAVDHQSVRAETKHRSGRDGFAPSAARCAPPGPTRAAFMFAQEHERSIDESRTSGSTGFVLP